MKEKDLIDTLKENLNDSLYDIKENYSRALDLVKDMQDERDKEKEDKQEIVSRLEWVLGADLNEMENTIHDIISEFKEKA
ncbi:hypothetical protein [Clostridium cadaveris]|uniref:hypothetical protein n=2 Tax=Clostridium cadaveris TaxID=1529 RepID=UPI0015B3B089|nr:hypothetical protein [Clostridium cadaveris]NWK12125.1 hypothetical protein [Clostridium cadaveris]